VNTWVVKETSPLKGYLFLNALTGHGFWVKQKGIDTLVQRGEIKLVIKPIIPLKETKR